MFRIVLPLLIVFSLLVACGDETTTVYSSGTVEGSVFGRVVPADSRTSVVLRGGGNQLTSHTDEEGYFGFSSLSAGLYELHVQTTTGFSREIPNVLVEQGRGTSVGTVDLLADHAWPIYGLFPKDGANEVLLSDSIVLLSDALIDTTSLKTEVRFSPPIQGKWHLRVEEEYAYTFVPSLPLVAGTTYHVEVTDDLKTLDGEKWQHGFTSQFSTTILRLLAASSYYGLDNVPPYQGYCCPSIALLTFNLAIDPVSTDSVYCVPEASVSAYVSGDNPNQLYLAAEGHLTPGQEYHVVLKGIRARGSQSAVSTDTLHFKVSPIKVTSFYAREPYSGSVQLDPIEKFRGYLIFNARINVDSLNRAMTIDPPISGIWFEAESYSETYYRFFPTDSSPLIADTTYTINIDGDVSLYKDIAIGVDQSIQFKVNPARVTGVSPVTGTANVYNSVRVSVSFNSAMNRSITESAFSLRLGDTLAVAGTFSWVRTSTSEILYFDPNANLPSGFYTVRVSAGATSLTGSRLEQAHYSFFTSGY